MKLSDKSAWQMHILISIFAYCLGTNVIPLVYSFEISSLISFCHLDHSPYMHREFCLYLDGLNPQPLNLSALPIPDQKLLLT